MAGRKRHRDRLDARHQSGRGDARRRRGAARLPVSSRATRSRPGRGPDRPDRGAAGRHAVEVTPRGWRLAERPGRDLARARSMLSSDLDALEEVLDGFRGPVKVQLCGPWTLAATLELPRTMNVAVADAGAVADLTASLAEGAAAFAADVAKRVPGARLVVQFDEPALPAVAEGMVPTASGLSRLAAVEADPLRERLEQVLREHPRLHGRALLCPLGSVRDNQGGRGGRGRLRPQPAAARRRGRDGRGGGGRDGDVHGRGGGRARPGRRGGRAGTPGLAGSGRAGGTTRLTAPARRGRPRSGSSGCGGGWGCRWRPARSRR